MDEKIESRVVKNGSIIKVGVTQIGKVKKENKKERAYLKKSDEM